MLFVDVILPLPLEGMFTYSVPQNLSGAIGERKRVLVPVGPSKTYVGIIGRIHQVEPEFKCRDILNVIDEKPIILPEQQRLWQWIADYYLSPIGEVFNAAMPGRLKAEEGFRPRTETYVTLAEEYRNEESLNTLLDNMQRARAQKQLLLSYLSLSHYDSLNGSEPEIPIAEVSRDELVNSTTVSLNTFSELKKRGILVAYQREVGRLNLDSEENPEAIKQLNDVQTKAYDEIITSFRSHDVTLLHGVTSSGKTEIYIHLIWKAINEGKQVLYLLPEIALTVQIMARLRKVFGSRLGIYHSKYSDEERAEIWQKQMSDKPFDVILGARSAVFLPQKKLGLIIIDEEHETSFKQQDPAPRYHARSVAIVLAKMTGAKTLLGTATPSMESYYNTMTGKYGLVELSTRYKNIKLPEIEVVDVKDLQRRKMMRGIFSPLLIEETRKALDNGQQVIFFQNRRGYSPTIECRTCGWVPKCQNCDVSLTYHMKTNVLTCHYCGYTYSVPHSCPACEETALRQIGYGTERIEDQIHQMLPSARIARMDLDTTRTHAAYERIINDFAAGRTNLLIGTQMISKGLDFDNVAVVGILSADSMTNMPDFRAYESAFMMMSQVSGRAGRKGKQGKVILQTRDTELPLLRHIVKSDYKAFFQETLNERRQFSYPPFSHLFYVIVRHRNSATAEQAAYHIGALLRKSFGNRLLGPDKPSIARVKQQHIRKFILKIENGVSLTNVRAILRRAAQQTLSEKRFSTVTILFDADPL